MTDSPHSSIRSAPTEREPMAKKTEKAPKRSTRVRQAELPGVERKRIKEIDTAAEAHVIARDARMKLTEEEVETQSALIAVMKKHNLTVYRDEEAVPPLIVTLTTGKDKVKITRADKPKAENAG